MSTYYTVLTEIGKAKIANATVTNTKVNITKVAVGDANGVAYSPTGQETSLKRQTWLGNVTALEVDANNPNWVVVETSIPSTIGGFTMREIGLYDDTNTLIAIGNYPDTYKPVMDDGTTMDLVLNTVINVENATSVTTILDPTVVIASRKYVQDAIDPITTQLDKIAISADNYPRLAVEVDDSGRVQRMIDYALSLPRAVIDFLDSEYIISKSIVGTILNNRLSLKGDVGHFIINDASRMNTTSLMGEVTAHKVFDFIGGDATDEKLGTLRVDGLHFINNDLDHDVLGLSAYGAFDKVRITSCKAENFVTFANVGRKFYSSYSVSGNPYYYQHSALNAFYASDCDVKGGGKGQNPNAFHVHGSYHSIVDNCRFYDSDGYMVRFNGGEFDTVPRSFAGNSNVIVRDCAFEEWGAGLIALQVTKTVGVSITDNNFKSSLDDTDNPIDLFNCFDATITGNQFKGGRAIWFGHADLNGATYKNDLRGARRCIITNNTFIDWNRCAVFIGGDGTVGGNRASHNIIIADNIAEFIDKVPTNEAFIESFLCNGVKVHDNIVRKAPIFLNTYYDRWYDIHDNTLFDVPTCVYGGKESESLPSWDASTQATHRHFNNKLFGTSGSVNTFERLNANNTIMHNVNVDGNLTAKELRLSLAEANTDVQKMYQLQLDQQGSKLFKWNRAAGGNPLTIRTTIAKGSAFIKLKGIYNAAVGGGNVGSVYFEDNVLLHYSTLKPQEFILKNIDTGLVTAGSFTYNITTTIAPVSDGVYDIVFTITHTATNNYDELMVQLDYVYLQNE